jgi:hypothetical protein
MIKLLSKPTRYFFSTPSTWANAELHKPNFGETQTVTLIPGIGIGPEITRIYLLIQDLFSMSLKLQTFQSSLK